MGYLYLGVIIFVSIPLIYYISTAIVYPPILLHLAFVIIASVFGVVHVSKVDSTRRNAREMAEDAVRRSFENRRKEIELEIKKYEDQKCDQMCDLEEHILPCSDKEINDIIKYREIDDLADEDIDAFFFGLAYCPSFKDRYHQSWLYQYCVNTEKTFQELLKDFSKKAVDYINIQKMSKSDPKRSSLDFCVSLQLICTQNIARSHSVNEKKSITRMIESGSKTWKIHFMKILHAVMITEIIIDITSRMEIEQCKESNREVCDDMREFQKQLIHKESEKALTEEQKIFVRLVEKGVKKLKYMDKIDLEAIYYS